MTCKMILCLFIEMAIGLLKINDLIKNDNIMECQARWICVAVIERFATSHELTPNSSFSTYILRTGSAIQYLNEITKKLTF